MCTRHNLKVLLIQNMLERLANFKSQFMDEIKHLGVEICVLIKVVTWFGFIKNVEEPCVYKKVSGSIVIFLVLYVDDILLIENDTPMMNVVKSSLRKSFSMKDLGEVAYILGIKIYRDRSMRLIRLSQDVYID
jgi:hypothetical protein